MTFYFWLLAVSMIAPPLMHWLERALAPDSAKLPPAPDQLLIEAQWEVDAWLPETERIGTYPRPPSTETCVGGMVFISGVPVRTEIDALMPKRSKSPPNFELKNGLLTQAEDLCAALERPAPTPMPGPGEKVRY